MTTIERWMTAKTAVQTELDRLNGALATYVADFKAKTGQEPVNTYEPLIPAERQEGRLWMAAAKGRPCYIHEQVTFVEGDNGNCPVNVSVSKHWAISLKQAEKLATELKQISDEQLVAYVATLAAFN